MAERLLTPQQELFLALYTNPKSETFGNARQTALKVGYSSLEILGIIFNGGKFLEKEIHRVFSRFNHHGEWFRPNKVLIDYINDEVNKYNYVKP